MDYNFRDIEQKWQKRWVENGTYRVVEDKNKKKFYVLNMFPYPSGAGLHVGRFSFQARGAYSSVSGLRITSCGKVQ